jgi:hypothetical protein
VFISETRQESDHVRNLRFRAGLNNCFVVESAGKGGGLALFWDDSIKFDIILYGVHYIDRKVWSNDLQLGWRQTFVYGEPRVQDRHLMWALLRRIKPCHTVLGSWWEILTKLFGLWKTFHQIEDQKNRCKTLEMFYPTVTSVI